MTTQATKIFRNTKIVATVGPGSRSPLNVELLALAGVNVFRLNFSHGSHEDHALAFETIRNVAEKTGLPLGILADLQGPKIRVGTFEGGKTRVGFNAEFDLIEGKTGGNDTTIAVPHAEILANLEVGDTILVDDGMLIFRVIAAGPGVTPRVQAVVPGVISDKKGFTVRDKALPVAALTEKDKIDLDFARKIGVDMIALSFVQTAEDVLEAKALAGPDIPLIAKIERPAAVENLDSVVEASDAIMVARGDLGVEYPSELVPVIQRQIIRAARSRGRPVIVATQMLQSMVDSATPTRAEASDVASAVYQGADAVMLSAETAVGRHPATAVAIMSRIILATEAAEDYRSSLFQFKGVDRTLGMIDVIASAVQEMAETEDANCVALRTGAFRRLARFSRVRGRIPVFYGSVEPHRCCQAALLWGVQPFPLHEADQNWQQALAKAGGREGAIAYAAWQGPEHPLSWMTGVIGKT